jgi:hypothetical protein
VPTAKKPSARRPPADFEKFLLEVLANGPLTVADLERKARAAGLLGQRQRATVSKPFKAAKKALGVRSVHQGFGRGATWFWELSADIPECKSKDHISEKPVAPIRETPVAPVILNSAVTHDLGSVNAGVGCPKGSLVVGVSFGPPPEFLDVNDVPRSWRDGVTWLTHRAVPRDIPPHIWPPFVTDCHRFIRDPDHGAMRAANLGWSALELFGCSRVNPLGYLNLAGLLWAIRGSRISRLHRDGAQIDEAINQPARAYDRRRMEPTRIVLPWLLP